MKLTQIVKYDADLSKDGFGLFSQLTQCLVVERFRRRENPLANFRFLVISFCLTYKHYGI